MFSGFKIFISHLNTNFNIGIVGVLIHMGSHYILLMAVRLSSELFMKRHFILFVCVRKLIMYICDIEKC